ncbi:MAG TPA: MBL fold metallo-hydrolase [Acidisphaera sp.]|nr:MBL fold metallo-hydrolase [Acidisphaera sp.]
MADVIRIGDVEIHRIVEQEGPLFDALTFFPTLGKERLDELRSWLCPRFLSDDGRLVLCVQSYVVRTSRHTIMIDTCVGNHKQRPARPFWHMMTSDRYERNLAAAGLRVEDIDFVMCTHLHVDHVGWNTRLADGRWVPTFPNARYVFADRELDFWTERHKTAPEACPWMADSVLPIVAAQRADTVASSYAFDDLVRLVPTPGHTIDHFSVQVGHRAADAIITGDMVHSPLQVRLPEVGMMSDYDSAQAGATRRSLFGQYCDTPTLFCAAHFPSPSTGRIVRRGETFDFVES